MALNTSDRYKYIFGSSVEKFDDKEEYSYQAQPEKKHVKSSPEQKVQRKKELHPQTEAAIRKNRAALEVFDWRYTVMTILAVVIIMTGAICYVHGTVTLSTMSKQISDLKAQKVTLESKKSALQAEIDKSINLDEIAEYAQKELNMTYPDSSHVIYYQDESSDYFRQYESVDAKK